MNPMGWNPNFVAVSGPTLYSQQAQSISCSALAQLADIQQQQGGGGGDRMSRSLTCLGLAGTIPEGMLQILRTLTIISRSLERN